MSTTWAERGSTLGSGAGTGGAGGVRVDLPSMTTKRGAPTLIEVLRSGSGASVRNVAPPPPGKATQVSSGMAVSAGGPRSVAQAGPPPSASGGPASMPSRRASAVTLDRRVLLIGAGVLVVVLAIVWMIAYKSGHAAADNAITAKLGLNQPNPDASKPSQDNTVTPPRPDGSGVVINPLPGGNDRKPAPTPPAPMPPPPKAATTQLIDGLNYLAVERFKRIDDANLTAQYLSNNGMNVVVALGSDVGIPGRSGDDWHYVIVAEGFERTGASEAKSLAARVLQLGQAWKTQNSKAPSRLENGYWFKLSQKK